MTDFSADVRSLRPLTLQDCFQQTLKTSIFCVGVGLHSGARVKFGLLPAPVNTGIVFRRTDLGVDIPARFDHVVDTRLCTQVGHPDQPQASVRTVEHVMAALSAASIDNVIVTVDGPEIPVLDGSSAPFSFLIACAGRTTQSAPRRVIEVRKTVRVAQGEGFAELHPLQHAGAGLLEMSVSIDFAAQAIGRQARSLVLTEESFAAELAEARTFTMRAEIEALRAAGLARGGDLTNAIVVDGPHILNPEGLRSADEFVRHKMLDAVGDLAMAGAPIAGRFVAHRTGHALNNALLRAVFADASAWRMVNAGQTSWAALAA